jgi:voltage-gated potassium channel Kch
MAWCFAIASALHFLGFGIEIGALLAGISLAGLEFSRDIEARIRPLRDFFLILFFIFLGTTLSLDALGAAIVPGIIFSLFILIGNPLILMIILRVFGYHPRTGFLVGVTMAQISEFSFILLASAAVAGFVEESILPLTTVVALVTIAVSTYLIKYNEQLYDAIEWIFRPLEVKREKGRKRLEKAPEVIMLGYHGIGETILPTIKKMADEYLIVDFDPLAIKQLEQMNIPHLYGDAGNEETLKHIRADKAKIVISTIPDDAISRDVIELLKKKKRSRAAIIVTVKTPEQAAAMYKAGANFVIVPSILGGEHFAGLLEKKKTRKASWTTEGKKQKKAFGV